MMDRILVPLDGSPAAEAILPYVALLAGRGDAQVLLLRAFLPPATTLGGLVPVLPAFEDYLRGPQADLVRQGIRARTTTRIEGAVPAILQTARERGVSLIAMATHGRTGLPHLLLGGTCEGVLRATPVPVFALRPFGPPREPRAGFRNILVPLDESAGSLSILPAAAAFARLFGSRLVFLHVLEPRKAALAALGRDGRERAGDEAPALETAAHQCAVEGLTARLLVDTGDVRGRILSRIRSERIDLVAMTARGRSGLSRLLFGSVSGTILRRADVPLLLCRE